MSRSRLALTLTAALCILAAGAFAQDGEKITFKYKSPAAGDAQGVMDKTSSNTAMRMSRDGEDMPERKFGRTQTIKKEIEILAADDTAIKKAKITYREVESQLDHGGEGGGGRRGGGAGRFGGEERATLEDIDGLTFVLEFGGEEVKVTDAEGAEVEERIARLVRRRESREGKFSGWGPDLREIIPTTPLSIGQTIKVPAEKAGFLVARGRGMRMGRRGGRGGRGGRGDGQQAQADAPKADVTLTLVRTAKSFGTTCGVFNVSVKSQRTTEASEEMPMEGSTSNSNEGTMVVGLDNLWLYKMDMKGTSTMSRSMSRGEMEIEMDSEGQSTSSKVAIFHKKKADK